MRIAQQRSRNHGYHRRQPRCHSSSLKTGGFASPPFDGFARIGRITMPNKPPRNKQPRSRSGGRPRPAADVLRRGVSGGPLEAIRQAGALAQGLRERLLRQLPELLRGHVAGVIVKPGELVVFADAAAWAARLKIEFAEQRPELAPELPTDAKVTVRVMPTGEFRR